jgi:hypothetical protein
MKTFKQFFFVFILLTFVSTNTFSVERDNPSVQYSNQGTTFNQPLKVSDIAKEYKSPVVKEKVTFFTKVKSKFNIQKKEGKKIGLAVAGFILSIVGLFVFAVPLGILGVTLSSIALTRALKSPDTHQGKGLAIAGLAIGVVDIIVGIILIAGAL